MRRGFLATLVVALLLFSAATLMIVPQLSHATTINWSALHGTSYNWSPIWKDIGGGTPKPSISFPAMASSGFNFDEQEITWNTYDNATLGGSVQYLKELQWIAGNASANGMFVVYDFGSNDCTLFPANVLSASHIPCDTAAHDNEFLASFEANNFTIDSLSIWKYTMSEFWGPIIVATQGYSSTIGYELMDEPPQYTASNGTDLLQNMQTWFATQVRSQTGLAIVVGSPSFDTEPSQDQPPASVCLAGGSTCVLDVHYYAAWAGNPASVPSNSTILNQFDSWASVAKGAGYPMITSQWGVCSSENSCYGWSNTTVRDLIDTIALAAHQNNLGMSWWFWNCQEGSNDLQSLVSASGCSTDGSDSLRQMVEYAYDLINWGPVTPTVSTTTSTTTITTVFTTISQIQSTTLAETCQVVAQNNVQTVTCQ